MARLCVMWLIAVVLSFHQVVVAFTSHARLPSNGYANIIAKSSRQTRRIITTLSSSNEDWGLEDTPQEENEDPRLSSMRNMLESSWNPSMGIVPTDPQKAAEAASESVANAMAQNTNVMMIDLRLPSYDVTEGTKMYDIMAAYDFCSFLSDNLRERGLIRKSLVLVRNEKERTEIDRVVSKRDDVVQTKNAISSTTEDITEEDDTTETEVDDFRNQLMSSWDTDTGSSSDEQGVTTPSPQKKTAEVANTSSHRLWSSVGSEEISNGADQFDQVIAAADQNAILSGEEDALIILAPYDTVDIIALRRTMARYGQTRTIIIVNSRIETLPIELSPAVLVYGMLPLVAVSKGGDGSGESGLKAVVMKRFPSNWSVYVDVYGDGFVEAKGNNQQVNASSDKQFPSPEWIAQKVKDHVEGLPKQ